MEASYYVCFKELLENYKNFSDTMDETGSNNY